MARTRILVSGVALVLVVAACGGHSKPASTGGRSAGSAAAAVGPAAACPDTRVAAPGLVALALRADGLAPCWTAFGGANAEVLAVDGQTVVVTSTPCTGNFDAPSDLIALDTATGKQLWRADGAGVPDSSEEHGVRAAGDHVLITAGKARDTRTGELLWELGEAEAQADGPDFVVTGVDVLEGNDVTSTYLVAERRTGRERWRSKPLVGGSDAIVADATSVLINDGNGETIGYDAKTGQQRWTAQFPLSYSGDGENSLPSIVLDDVVIGLEGDRTRGRDIATGRVIWTIDSALGWQPGIANGITGRALPVYFADFSAGLLDVRTGKTLWTSKEAGLLQPGPSVMLAMTQRGISGLDLNTGKELWTTATSKLDTLPHMPAEADAGPVGPEQLSVVVSSDRAFFSYVNCSPGEND